MNRTGWLGALALAAIALGAAARLAWPSAKPALDCPPEDVRWDGGVALCARGAPQGEVPAGQALALGSKLDLNRATEEDLALLPGIGPSLARALVGARAARGRFRDWSEVDAVPGIGPAKLEALRASATLDAR